MARLLTIQDISCVGLCSTTVALPVVTACKTECCILPSAILSTHTGGFKNYTFLDLTLEMPKILNHWQSEGIKFDGLYTGYIGSPLQFEYILRAKNEFLNEGGLTIVDPVMADNGCLYAGFNSDFPQKMAELCAEADIILPNLTEACLMTGVEYKTEMTEEYVQLVINKLALLGCKNIILTGVSFQLDKIGACCYNTEEKVFKYFFNDKIEGGFHGTGDLFASCVAGLVVGGKTIEQAVRVAVDFTCDAIIASQDEKETHSYGVQFEKVIGNLAKI